jgi:hypothetical protein
VIVSQLAPRLAGKVEPIRETRGAERGGPTKPAEQVVEPAQLPASEGPIAVGPPLWEKARQATASEHKWDWLNSLEFREAAGDRVRLQVREQDRARARFIRSQKADDLRKLLSELAGKPVEVNIDDPAGGAGAVKQQPTGSPHDRALAEHLPLTHQVLDIFGGRVVDLRDDDSAAARRGRGPAEPTDEQGQT